MRVPNVESPLGRLPEIRTSTRMPGTTKPATPTTSLTRTGTARIPGGIMAARPPPAPFGAMRDSIMGSLAKMGVITPRPTMSCVFIAAPVGTAPGQSDSFTSSSFSTVPTSMSRVASTICAVVGAALAACGRFSSSRYSSRLATDATTNANIRTPTNRLFIYLLEAVGRQDPFGYGPFAGFPGAGCAATRSSPGYCFRLANALRPWILSLLPSYLVPSLSRRLSDGWGIPKRPGRCRHAPSGELAGTGVGVGELGVRRRPDPLDAAAGAQKQGRRSQRHERHQQRVLDEVLALLVIPEIAQKRHVRMLLIQLLGFNCVIGRSLVCVFVTSRSRPVPSLEAAESGSPAARSLDRKTSALPSS